MEKEKYHKIKENVNLIKEVERLNNEIKNIKEQISPNSFVKVIDSSYLSTHNIHNIRLWLQILAIIFTVFLAGAGLFGYLGFSNMLELRKEVDKVVEIRRSINESFKSVKNIENEICKKDTLINTTLNNAIMFIKNKKIEIDSNIVSINSKVAENIKDLDDKMDIKLSDFDVKISKINQKLGIISNTFNNVVTNNELLNLREKQIMYLLALDIEPNNPIFNYNAAKNAFRLNQFQESLKYCDFIIENKKSLLKKLMKLKN